MVQGRITNQTEVIDPLSKLEKLFGADVLKFGFTPVPRVLELVWTEARVRDTDDKTGEITERKLSSTARIIGLSLLSHMYAATYKQDPYVVWPSGLTLAHEANCSLDQVTRAIHDLKAAGLIRRKQVCVDIAKPDFTPDGYDLRPLVDRMQQAAPRYFDWHKDGVEKARQTNREAKARRLAGVPANSKRRKEKA